LHELLVALAGVVVLVGCQSPEDSGHRIYGYVDADGREVIAPQFLAALPFHEGLAAVLVAAGWGYIDTAGRWVIPPGYQSAASFSGDRAAVRDASGAWGYIDRSGRWVIAPRYLRAGTFIGDRAFAWLDDEHAQVLDRDGRVVEEQRVLVGLHASDALEEGAPNSYWNFSLLRWQQEELAATQAERLVPLQDAKAPGAYIDPAGRPVTTAVYDDLNAFVAGRARVKSDDKLGFIDREGHVVVPPRYDDALLRFSRDRTVAVHDGQAWLVDAQGRDVASLGVWPWPDLGKDEGFSDLATFVGHDDFFADGLMPWRRDGRWGYVDLDGRWIIEPRFEMAHPFHHGRASVQAGGRGVLIDVQGREIASVPRGWWIAPGGGTRLMVGTLNAWGFADADGKPPAVLPYATISIKFLGQRFADARPLQFSEGLAVVSRLAPHRWKVLDVEGHERAAGRYDWVKDAGGGMYAVAVGQRWALADGKLRAVSDARFDEQPGLVTDWDDGDLVRRDGRFGCVDRRGHWRPLPGDVVYADCRSPLMAVAAERGKQGVLAGDGRWVIPPRYEAVWRLDVDGAACFTLKVTAWGDATVGRIACVRQGQARYSQPREYACVLNQACFLREASGWHRLDFSTLQVTEPSYNAFRSYTRGQVVVQLGERWGLMAVSGHMSIPAEFDEMASLADASGRWPGALKVRRDQRWGVVAPDGREVLPVRYDAVERLAPDLFAVREGPAWGVVRERGEVVVPPRFDEILELSGEVLLAKSAGTVHLEMLDGRALLDPSPPWLQRIHQWSDFSEGYWAAFTLDRELYFVDKNTRAVHRVDPPQGRVWLEPGYLPRVEDAVAGFRRGGFSGFLYVRPPGAPAEQREVPLNVVVVDANGQLLPWVFDGVVRGDQLRANHYLVHLQGKCGVIDHHGRWTVPATHDHCDAIDDGLIIVGDEDY
jgi:hypothetical protein